MKKWRYSIIDSNRIVISIKIKADCTKEKQVHHFRFLGIGLGLAWKWGWCGESCQLFNNIPLHEPPLQVLVQNQDYWLGFWNVSVFKAAKTFTLTISCQSAPFRSLAKEACSMASLRVRCVETHKVVQTSTHQLFRDLLLVIPILLKPSIAQGVSCVKLDGRLTRVVYSERFPVLHSSDPVHYICKWLETSRTSRRGPILLSSDKPSRRSVWEVRKGKFFFV